MGGQTQATGGGFQPRKIDVPPCTSAQGGNMMCRRGLSMRNDSYSIRKEVFRFSGLANLDNGKGLRTPFLHRIFLRTEVPYDKYGKEVA